MGCFDAKTLIGLFGKKVKVICNDGDSFEGVLVDHTSADDNEPDGESITIKTFNVPYLEIYVDEILSVQKECPQNA